MEEAFPTFAAKAVFVADAHLSGDDVHTRNFVALAEAAAAEGAALFLLGDIFDLWFGTPSLTFGFQKPVIERLRELRRKGLGLYYVEGNRDFHLKKFHAGQTFDVVSEGDMRAVVGPFRLHLAHGDTVNRADLAYRFWKALSKNRIAYGALGLLPPPVVLPLADRLERRLKRTNKRFRGSFPESECRDFALRLFASGIDVVLLGHFHAERLLRFSPGRPGKVLAVLPSWREGQRHFYLDADGSCGFRTFRPGEILVPRDAPPAGALPSPGTPT